MLKVEVTPQLATSLLVFSCVFFCPPCFPQSGKLVPSVAPRQWLLKGAGGGGGGAGVGVLGA